MKRYQKIQGIAYGKYKGDDFCRVCPLADSEEWHKVLMIGEDSPFSKIVIELNPKKSKFEELKRKLEAYPLEKIIAEKLDPEITRDISGGLFFVKNALEIWEHCKFTCITIGLDFEDDVFEMEKDPNFIFIWRK